MKPAPPVTRKFTGAMMKCGFQSSSFKNLERQSSNGILRHMANATNDTLLSLELPGIAKLRSGKVRELFDLGDRYLMVASDRISAFDVIMPNGIPRKGEVLTQISHFWF